jgi:TolA-binding protein
VRTLAAAFCGLLAALLLSQAGESAPRKRVRSRADAGPIVIGTDPPGRLRPSPDDAGVSVPAPDAGETATQRQIADLRARVEGLEQKLAQTQQQSEDLQQIAAELRLLRAQVAEAEAQRQGEEQARAARQQQVQSAVDALGRVQYSLASGNDDDISAALDQAQAAFSGQAQRDVQMARAALQNRDLALARTYLAAAISDALQGR